MRLIVLRHGKAEPRSESGSDADRKLVDRGVRQAEFIAKALRERELLPGRIVTSPIERALQTARIVQRGLATAGLECPLEIAVGLETDRPLGSAARVVAEHAHAVSTLLIVGHNPQLEALVVAATNDGVPPAAEVLKTGQAVVLDVPDPDELIGGSECLEVLRLPGE